MTDIITLLTDRSHGSLNITSWCLSTTTTRCEVRGLKQKSALALLYFCDFMVLQMFAAGETGLHIDQHTVYYDAMLL